MPASAAVNPEALLLRLEWTVLKRLDGLLHGNYRTLFRGFGMDLADLREYQFNDDVRYIDWNVTARLQIPHVREFLEERELTAWFLLDLSPSVDFGSRERKKRTISSEFVGTLAHMLSRYGNRIGAMFYGGELDMVVPARNGRTQTLQILEQMNRRPEMPTAPATDLGEFLRGASQVMKRRSAVFVVSDFISSPGWEKPMAQLAQRHEVLAVRLYDPLEMELPDLGLFTIQDAETGEQMFVDTHDKGFRKRFAAAAEQREAALRESFALAGVDALELSTEDDLVDALMRFIDLRKLRNRMSAGATGGLPSHLEGTT